ncbi:uncharacterized protein F4807DRAFT_253841 [Annulohypoxylon truncatum]|uniref:uncharacterized protein n=1 Tax=Annulohypoxylon truncatum TaxID=327061 RepID=UPI002007D413|nr:uncharacterized protein F4807DRAFT_253841 [Annulohypoxylon truncatum]KAI1205829.1 hypothetical protein F4807DRAFT_253841 [Annulohypoxylon truncatum]
MMATEPTVNQPDASITEPIAQPAVSSNTAQDAGHSSATLNGSISDVENKQIAEIVDELVNSAEVSVSGGSDTESSKARLGDKNHARTSSSIKKPQSFKSVSVNRTYLASKTAANSNARPDSATGSTSSTPQPTPSTSASRLKLVAKSGSSLGGSTKTLSSNGKPASAPDPNTVWNRNKPVSQPEQKKLSDEELMHKYGIHMAGRLGPEDTKGQSNWADIDDDEEWAPDHITWTDGTKITLPHETAPSPNVVPATLDKEPAPAPVPVPVSAPPKSKSPAPISSATGSPSVKPGVVASGKSLVLKGAPEKPTLVTKPQAPPTPAKSPWARLPPIEKVPPVQSDTTIGGATSQSPVTKSASTPTTKEIAADDFSRSGFRDRHAGNHSQLFNSHSGQYDPVPDHRRGSRNEPHGRQPAVLQRPQYHDQQGPAEPSAAFQTSRTSGQEGPYRRRGSSNVSGTSGILARKPYDIQPPADSFQSRTESVTGAESPISAHTQPTPRLPVVHPYQPRLSPGQNHAAPYYSSPAVDMQPTDDLEMQAVIMRERREQAIRRRSEQEAREEAARKARIAEKLKAMGPPPERNSANKERSNEDSTVIAPVDSTHPDPSNARSGGDNRANGEVKRPLSQVDKPQGQQMRTSSMSKSQHPTSWPEAQHPERYPSWGNGPQNTSRNVWGAPGNDRSLGNGTFNPDLGTLPDSRPPPIGDRNHRPAPIGPPRTASQQPVRPEAMSNNRLAPIGPPRGRSANTSQGPESGAANPWKSFASNVKEDDRRRAIDMQAKIDAQKDDVSLPMSEDWRNRATGKPASGGARQGMADAVNNHHEVRSSSSYNASAANTATNAARDEQPARPSEEDLARWKGRMPSDYAAARQAREAAAREAKEAAARESRPTAEDLARWKGRMPSDYTAAREAREAAAAKMNGSNADFGRQPTVGPSRRTVTSPAAQPRSSSRFFPSTRESQYEDDLQEQVRTKSPTPPPPTADGHPVFDGDSTRPHVALPPARPIVKLPPPTNSAGPSPVMPPAKPAPISFAAAAAAPVRAHQQSTGPRPSSRGRGYGGIHQTPYEISSQENWQEKINTLFGKNTSPAPIKSLAVDSSSRIALDHSQSYDPATVALPGLSHSVSSLTSDGSDYTSREMAEECFGEQEMGSLPTVRLPSEAPDALWQPAELHVEPMPIKLRVDPLGAEAWRFSAPEMSNGRNVIRISGPFMAEAKTVLMRHDNGRSNSNQRRQGPRGGARRLSGRGGQRGGREHSDHPGDHSSHPPSRPSTRSGRGNYRPRMENMAGRHTSTAAPSQWS